MSAIGRFHCIKKINLINTSQAVGARGAKGAAPFPPATTFWLLTVEIFFIINDKKKKTKKLETRN